MKVPFGYKVTLYADDNFSGRTKVITNDTSWIGSDFNDITSSIKVEKAKYTIINTKSPSDLQPGDILVYSGSGSYGHTMIYIGDQGDGNVAVEASLGDHPPRYANIGRVQTQLGYSTNVVARLNK